MSRFWEGTIYRSDVRKYLKKRSENKRWLKKQNTTLRLERTLHNHWLLYCIFGKNINDTKLEIEPMDINWCFICERTYDKWTDYEHQCLFFSNDKQYTFFSYYYDEDVLLLIKCPTYKLFKNAALGNIDFAYKDDVLRIVLQWMYEEIMASNMKNKHKIRKTDFRYKYNLEWRKENFLNAMTIYLNFKAQNYGK